MKSKFIEGTNDSYIIYENGDVFSLKRNRKLAHHKFALGYVSVCIMKNGKSQHITLHRLLAEAFLPNPENKPTVNHINGIKNDNRLENLQWATYSENNSHAFKTGLNKAKSGEDSRLSTISRDTASKILDMYKTKKMSEIAKELDLGYTLVRNICLRKSWRELG